MSEPVTAVLFVCLGNICRSPLAEALFLHHAGARGVGGRFVVDSAGTGAWHAGERADARMRAVAARRGVEIASIARAVTPDDLERFDLLVCMDRDNHETLRTRGAPSHKLRLMLSYDPDATLREVPDPYYGGEEGFERVFDLVDAAARGMLDELLGWSPGERGTGGR